MVSFDLVKPIYPKDERENDCKGEFEDVDRFYQFLQDDCKLDADAAFSVIYHLQEFMPLIPECIEKCDACNKLFDSESEGRYCDKCFLHHCDSHSCDCESDEDEDEEE